MLWDASDRLVLCNSHFQKLHKLPDSAVIPGTSYETVIEVGRMPEVRTRQQEGSNHAPGARTFEAQLDDGNWLHVSERRTKDGGYVSVGTDITRIKAHEQKLVDNDLRLRATVIDLKRSQVALEQQTIELADLARTYAHEKVPRRGRQRAKSEFLANMSHELRTPLNAIIGFSEMMDERHVRRARLGRNTRSTATTSSTSGQHLLALINDILDMSKIEAGQMNLRMEPLDAARTVADRGADLEPRRRTQGLRGRRRYRPALPSRPTPRCKQMLLNLLSNAVKFTPEGGKVVVRSHVLENQIVLLIADSGIGIAPQSLLRLGRPFEQVESQLTKTYHGSGLGLAIARSLAHLHGGSMKLRSRLGAGTVVRVSLPRRPREKEAA